MALLKVAFTLDETTVTRLADAAARLSIPKSQVVREAIQEFHERIGMLSESEKRRLLRTFDEVVPRIPERSAAQMNAELRGIRQSRRAGGRKRRRTMVHS